MSQRKSLGRGLGALIPQKQTENPESKSVLLENVDLSNENQIITNSYKHVHLLDINKLLPSEAQPRQIFDEDKIAELSRSIEKYGILQPIVARQINAERYEIIAGERRWRASQKAGLKDIPAIVVEKADADVLAIALVENIQRQDLNIIEEAEAYQGLIEKLGYSQEDVAAAVGKSRSAVANTLRLLKLPKEVREFVLDDLLSMGHARALLSLDSDKRIISVAKQIIDEQWSVRDAENFVRFGELNPKVQKTATKKTSPGKKYKLPETQQERDVRLRLQKRLGSKVEIIHDEGKGYFKVHFNSYDELDALMTKIEA